MSYKLINLEQFLTIYLNKLIEIKIPYCILRNYEELPKKNASRDIDILIRSNDKVKAIKKLSDINGIKITDLCEREYVTSVFIFGVNWGENCNAIQIDFFTKLCWKGLPYLNVEDLIKHARPSKKFASIVIKPYSVHEAVNSFLSSYLIGGWIKKKYQPKIKSIFKKKKKEIILLLSQISYNNIAKDLVDSVCTDNYDHLYKILPKFRRSIFKTSLHKNPLFTLRAILSYYLKEIIIRYTPVYINEVCVLGPDGVGKSTVIEDVKNKLVNATKITEIRHLKPNIFKTIKSKNSTINPHGKAPRSNIVSILKIILWSFEYWIFKVFHGFNNPTLVIWDRYYHDILVDPRRYRYGAPMWVAHLIHKTIPKPDLIILFDAPAHVVQHRKKEVPHNESARQREEYFKLVSKEKNGIVINSALPLRLVSMNTQEAILKTMELKAGKHI
jgi:thymidylate kinase